MPYHPGALARPPTFDNVVDQPAAVAKDDSVGALMTE